MILKSEDIYNYPNIFNQEQMEFDKHNRFNLEQGCAWYEDEEGNIYRDKQEYLTETRDKKINEILK